MLTVRLISWLLSISIFCEISFDAAEVDNYFTIEVRVDGSDDASCLYVSKLPAWPFLSADGENKAEAQCKLMGLSLAELSGDEGQALQELTSKKMFKLRLVTLI